MREAGPQRRACVVLSPHLDDAVLSVWHVLGSDDDVRVVTVFAGVPEPGFVTALDRARGATESAAAVRRRRDDDDAVLALAGVEPVHAGLLDADYRAFRLPDLRAAIERDPARFISLVAGDARIGVAVEELREALEPCLRADVVHAPLGIGGHPDHRDVARLGLRLAAEGRDVCLYADLPYLVRFGRPTWLGGADGPARRLLAEAFAALPADPDAFARRVVELDPTQAVAKVAAFRRYETEFGPVNADFGGALDDPETLRREVAWTRRDTHA